MIIFDIDGVLRDIYTPSCGKDPDKWDAKINGKWLIEILESDLLKNVRNAPPTEYIESLKLLDRINLLSHQPKHWRGHTDIWLKNNLNGRDYRVVYVDEMASKLDYLLPGDVLVEDYPYYDNYSQILLINHKYNENVKGMINRIKNKNQLNKFIKGYNNDINKTKYRNRKY